MSAGDVTELLNSWNSGDAEALERLMPLVYAELRRLARRNLAASARDNTLQATALVHEAYMKLVDQRRATFHNRAHFLSVAAQLMRRIVIDHARERGAAKRGSNQKVQLEFEPSAGFASPDREQMLQLDAALDQLEAMHPGKGKLVELRYFGGLTIEETAEVMNLSTATIKRDWLAAKAWLARAMTKPAVTNPKL